MPIVKDSKIQGKGVFADRDYKKGEVIMKWDTSIKLTKDEALLFPERYKKYLVYHRGKLILSMPPERYLNHSCDPNTYEGDLCDIAKHDIKRGEELTTDYSLDAPPQLKMKCNCKKKGCKKVI